MHTPVLLKEVINHLEIKKGYRYIDATYGEGGYAKEILKLGDQSEGISRSSPPTPNLVWGASFG